MSNGISSAIIDGVFTLIGIVVGWLLTIFRHDIETIFRHIDNDDLMGRWRCIWILEDYDAEDNALEDIVEITKVTRKSVSGRSSGPTNTSYGSYRLEGKNSPFSICFSYFGEGKAKNLFGVTLLQRSPNPDIMTGQWCQLSADNTIIGGKTKWNKEP